MSLGVLLNEYARVSLAAYLRFTTCDGFRKAEVILTFFHHTRNITLCQRER